MPRGRGSEGDHGAGLNAYAARQFSFSSSDGEALLGPAYTCDVCSGWGTDLTDCDLPVTIGWADHPWAMADPSHYPYTYCAFLTGCCGT